jgi:Fic family protein
MSTAGASGMPRPMASIEPAAVFHNEFVRILPFRNGNGRMLRALMTLMMRRDGFDN